MTTPDAAPAPVFVDDTGRRHRAVKVVGWAVGVIVLAYLALLGISLVGSPGIVPLSLPALGRILPGPAAAPLGAATRGHGPREPVLPPATPAGVAPAAPAVQPAAVPSATTRPTTRRTTTSTPRPTLSPTPSPSPTHTPQANPSPNGSPRPSHGSTAHPSPNNTKRTTSSPAPTSTAT